jgi:type II secretory pathway pseudopilin PulG
MPRTRTRGALTWLDVLVILAMLASIMAVFLPALQASRESARRQACEENLRQIGLALGQYCDNHKAFPASSGVTRKDDGSIAGVDGWSWLVSLLPYYSQTVAGDPNTAQRLYDRLDVPSGRPLVEPAGRTDTPHADAMRVKLPGLSCPSFRMPFNARAGAQDAALTNYKAVGATHAESLSVASADPRPPKYGLSVLKGSGWGPPHPDGACFPGAGLGYVDLPRGTSNTLFAVESAEPRFARWTVGAEAAVVGLPPDVDFETWGVYFVVPKGVGRVSRDGTGADPSYWSYRTYLNWDYDERPYDGADGKLAGRYGPGSHHQGVTNHLTADGACHSIRKNIDVTVYMNLIMRLNGYLRPPKE